MKLTKTIVTGFDGALLSEVTYTYDSQGRLHETMTENYDGALNGKTNDIYDDRGYLIRTEGAFRPVSYTYDDKGQVIKETRDNHWLVYRYDAQGRLTATVSYGPHDPGLGIEKVETTYDTQGTPVANRTYYTQRKDWVSQDEQAAEARRNVPQGASAEAITVWGVLPEESWSQLQEAGAVAFQTDGKIVVVASGGFAVARYYPDGNLDPSFGTGGKVVTRLNAADRIEDTSDVYEGAGMVALQSDGKIVAAGRSDRGFAVVRYHPDGSLDSSFGAGGKVTTRIGTDPEIEDAASALVLQADGKIVVVGRTWQQYSNDIAVVRYNPDGALDLSFGADGIVTSDFTSTRTSPSLGANRATAGKSWGVRAGPARPLPLGPSYDEAFALAIQADGKLVVGGTSLVRYNPDGSLGASFGAGGEVRSEVRALALQSDGKIVAVSGAGGTFALARYNSDGSLDASFGAGGTVTTQLGRVDAASDVVLQADGKFVVVGKSFNGRSIDFAMVRYNSDGSVDSSFGKEGQITSNFCAHQIEERYAQQIGPGSISGGWRVRLQPDGRIVMAGKPSGVRCPFVVFRYTADGSLDHTFGEQGRVSTAIARDDGYLAAQTIQRDGKIVVAGASTGGFALARYSPDGSLDPSFGAGGKVMTRLGAGYLVQ